MFTNTEILKRTYSFSSKKFRFKFNRVNLDEDLIFIILIYDKEQRPIAHLAHNKFDDIDYITLCQFIFLNLLIQN